MQEALGCRFPGSAAPRPPGDAVSYCPAVHVGRTHSLLFGEVCKCPAADDVLVVEPVAVDGHKVPEFLGTPAGNAVVARQVPGDSGAGADAGGDPGKAAAFVEVEASELFLRQSCPSCSELLSVAKVLVGRGWWCGGWVVVQDEADGVVGVGVLVKALNEVRMNVLSRVFVCGPERWRRATIVLWRVLIPCSVGACCSSR